MIRAAVFAFALILPGAAGAEGVRAAHFADPTTRYDHGILGDAIEHGAIVIETDTGRRVRLSLPDTRVFEDVAPRVIDLDGDGAAEIVVVETDLRLGARLSVFGPNGLIASSPFIGQTHRWLAPVGAVDLDGDGLMELISVDRPHLARILNVWRFAPGQKDLTLIATLPGLTNHRIGDTAISGGIRDCGAGPEIITADPTWSQIMATRLNNGELSARAIAPLDRATSFAKALRCAD